MRRLIVVCLLASACQHSNKQNAQSPDAGTPTNGDRLRPDELTKSNLLVFGFPIPPGMHALRRFPDSVVLSGSISTTLLSQHVSTHALVGPALRDGRRIIYKNARLRNGAPNRLYTIEIDDLPSERQLTITDTTPSEAPSNLSNEERWRRAGYLPNGTPIPSAQSM